MTLETAAPPELAANFAPPEEDDRPTVMREPLVVGLPELSSSVTVKAFVAEEEVAALMAGEVMASLFAVPALTVSVWVAEASPFPVTVIEGLPGAVSPKSAVTDDFPEGRVTLVTAAPPELAANSAPLEGVAERLTVMAVLLVVGLP